MGARVTQWLEALTGNHRIESSNPTGAKEFVLCSWVRHLALITPWFESHVNLVVPCGSDNNPDCTLKLQTPSKRVHVIQRVMLGASVSRYTRPWIKLLVAKLILTPPQASTLVDTIRRRSRRSRNNTIVVSTSHTCTTRLSSWLSRYFEVWSNGCMWCDAYYN